MLHIKFRENRPAGSEEEIFLKGFYHILVKIKNAAIFEYFIIVTLMYFIQNNL